MSHPLSFQPLKLCQVPGSALSSARQLNQHRAAGCLAQDQRFWGGTRPSPHLGYAALNAPHGTELCSCRRDLATLHGVEASVTSFLTPEVRIVAHVALTIEAFEYHREPIDERRSAGRMRGTQSMLQVIGACKPVSRLPRGDCSDQHCCPERTWCVVAFSMFDYCTMYTPHQPWPGRRSLLSTAGSGLTYGLTVAFFHNNVRYTHATSRRRSLDIATCQWQCGGLLVCRAPWHDATISRIMTYDVRAYYVASD